MINITTCFARRFLNWLISLAGIQETLPKTTYGVTTDDKVSLDRIPMIVPEVYSNHVLATDLKVFNVVSVDLESSTVVISEESTKGLFEIDLDLFDFLFVPYKEDEAA